MMPDGGSLHRPAILSAKHKKNCRCSQCKKRLADNIHEGVAKAFNPVSKSLIRWLPHLHPRWPDGRFKFANGGRNDRDSRRSDAGLDLSGGKDYQAPAGGFHPDTKPTESMTAYGLRVEAAGRRAPIGEPGMKPGAKAELIREQGRQKASIDAAAARSKVGARGLPGQKKPGREENIKIDALFPDASKGRKRARTRLLNDLVTAKKSMRDEDAWSRLLDGVREEWQGGSLTNNQRKLTILNLVKIHNAGIEIFNKNGSLNKTKYKAALKMADNFEIQKGLAGATSAAAQRAWNELLHPRDSNGRFRGKSIAGDGSSESNKRGNLDRPDQVSLPGYDPDWHLERTPSPSVQTDWRFEQDQRQRQVEIGVPKIPTPPWKESEEEFDRRYQYNIAFEHLALRANNPTATRTNDAIDYEMQLEGNHRRARRNFLLGDQHEINAKRVEEIAGEATIDPEDEFYKVRADFADSGALQYQGGRDLHNGESVFTADPDGLYMAIDQNIKYEGRYHGERPDQRFVASTRHERGVSQSFIATDTITGDKFFVKKSPYKEGVQDFGWHDADAEVITEGIAKHMGIEGVKVRYANGDRNDPEQAAVVQQHIDDLTDAKGWQRAKPASTYYGTPNERRAMARQVDVDELASLVVMDYLTSQVDRHANNYWLAKEEGSYDDQGRRSPDKLHIIPIDNALAFTASADRYDHIEPQGTFLKPVDMWSRQQRQEPMFTASPTDWLDGIKSTRSPTPNQHLGLLLTGAASEPEMKAALERAITRAEEFDIDQHMSQLAQDNGVLLGTNSVAGNFYEDAQATWKVRLKMLTNSMQQANFFHALVTNDFDLLPKLF